VFTTQRITGLFLSFRRRAHPGSSWTGDLHGVDTTPPAGLVGNRGQNLRRTLALGLVFAGVQFSIVVGLLPAGRSTGCRSSSWR
jgi:hypothetical protein